MLKWWKAVIIVLESSQWLGEMNSYSAVMTSDTRIMVRFIIRRSPLGGALLRNWTRPFCLQTAEKNVWIQMYCWRCQLNTFIWPLLSSLSFKIIKHWRDFHLLNHKAVEMDGWLFNYLSLYLVSWTVSVEKIIESDKNFSQRPLNSPSVLPHKSAGPVSSFYPLTNDIFIVKWTWQSLSVTLNFSKWLKSCDSYKRSRIVQTSAFSI